MDGFTILLIFHVAGGAAGLLSGTVNLVLKKGNFRHKVIGKIFVWSMVMTGSTSLILALLHLNYFLFMTGVFTLYLVGSGARYIHLKMLGNNQKPSLLDWLLTITVTISGTGLTGLGIWYLSKGLYFGAVFIVFGILGLLFAKNDLINYGGKYRSKSYWLLAHISRMTGCYIASLTAFLVVNTHYIPVRLPSVVIWLLPSCILVPFIINRSRNISLKSKKQLR